MAQKELMGKFTGIENDIEVDGGFAESMETDNWSGDYLIVNGLHDSAGSFQRDALDLVQVAVIADADRNRDSQCLLRNVVICYDGGSNLLVWYDDSIAGVGQYGGETPGNVRYTAFFTAAKPYIVFRAQLLGQNKMYAGKDVGQGVLQPEGYGHAANAQGGHNGRYGDAAIFQDDESACQIDNNIYDICQQGSLGQLVIFLGVQVDKA